MSFFLSSAWQGRAAGLCAAVVVLLGGVDAGAASLASILRKPGPTPQEAKEALVSKNYDQARELYDKLLKDEGFTASARQELLYGLAVAEHNLTDYDGSTRNFSEALHSHDRGLRGRAHRGLGHTLYDQGALGLAKQPKITLQRWMDALSHFDAALEIEPDNKQLQENRDHVAKMLENLRKALDEMEKQQQGQKGQKGQKGDKGQQGQKGESGEGQEGQEGQQSGKEGQGGQPQGDEAEKKDNQGEKKGEDDGIGGKDAKNLPQGRIQAADGKEKGEQPGAGEEPSEKERDGKGPNGAKPGGEGGDEKKQMADKAAGDRRNPRTGFTPGEAEGLLRQYMDEITNIPMSNRQSIPPPNKKDW
ncbi:MAG: hypothetical protein HS117_11135 [Verrucomicrobiaceae bacterium]|jgi:Ca-activated chloride channel family protein|nr:hypothetical protein [Verrucomicrobiaceae bacterium]